MEVVAINAVFALICALVANSRGRSAAGWAAIGFFFGCFGMVVLLVIPDLKKQEAIEERLRNENRLLREQIRNNRMVSDQRHESVERRLLVHDRALGVDTSTPPELAAGAEVAAAPDALPNAAPPPGFAAQRWHYASEQRAEGPVSFDNLKVLWNAGTVTAATLVWSEGMANWTAVDQLPGFLESLRA